MNENLPPKFFEVLRPYRSHSCKKSFIDIANWTKTKKFLSNYSYWFWKAIRYSYTTVYCGIHECIASVFHSRQWYN